VAGAAAISLVVVAFMPRRSSPSRLATIPMIVIMQVGSAAASRSVGEKASPLP